MSDRLTNFLVNLATDPDRLQQYATDPAAALEGTDLTAEEKAAVLSRDTSMIRSALGQSAADHMTQTASTRQRRGVAKKKAAAKKKRAAKKGAAKKKTSRGGKKR